MFRLFTAGLLLAAALPAQDRRETPPVSASAVDGYDSRAEQIQALRLMKAGTLQPEQASKAERFLVEFRERRILEKFNYGWHGLRPRLGGLVTSSGFAFGPEYRNDELLDGAMIFRTSARISTRAYQHYDIELAMPRLAGGRLFVDLLGTHRNYPQVQYYGPGPDSRKTGRSNFRLEDTSYEGSAGVRPFRHLSLGLTAGFLEVNVGPGTRREWASTEQLYGPAQAPGIGQQSDFLRGAGFVQYDYRDNPGGARSGGNYLAQFTYNRDTDLRRHTFRQLELEAQQYIPMFNRRRVIALRARSVLSYANRNQVVPFYLQPALGGSDDLRGFRPFRFYGDNLTVFNAEYRYEIFSGLDMAVFADAGKVFQRRADWDLSGLEKSYGIGMRFNARNNVFFRIDSGWSREGMQIWFKFGNAF